MPCQRTYGDWCRGVLYSEGSWGWIGRKPTKRFHTSDNGFVGFLYSVSLKFFLLPRDPIQHSTGIEACIENKILSLQDAAWARKSEETFWEYFLGEGTKCWRYFHGLLYSSIDTVLQRSGGAGVISITNVTAKCSSLDRTGSGYRSETYLKYLRNSIWRTPRFHSAWLNQFMGQTERGCFIMDVVPVY